MQVTTKVRVTLELMHELAMRGSQGPTSLASIAWKLGVSLSYLEILCRSLRAKGLIVATRGPGGGYSLAQDPSEITVYEVIRAVELPGRLVGDGFNRPAVGEEDLVTMGLYERAEREIAEFLSQVTLRDLLPSATQSPSQLKNVAAISFERMLERMNRDLTPA
jgi:Rrf2 family transcriptional regulator, iron-sulfur cluster assembly transcription factor